MSRRYGILDGAALVVASVVGAGIFTVPAYVAALAGSPTVILGLWVIGGMMALAGALSYAELAARLPRGGAEYVYLRAAFGPTAGFLSGWTSFVAGFSGAMAAAAVAFAHNLVHLLPEVGAIPVPLLAIAVIAFFTAISVLGITAGRWVTNVLTVVIITGLLGITIGLGAGDRIDVGTQPSNPALLSALIPIFFTYSGWNAAAYVAGEFRDPARTIPRALILGTVVVTLLYVGLNAGLLRSMSANDLAQATAPVGLAARAMMGGAGSALVGTLVLVALASSVGALVITGSRIYREMAADGALPAALGYTGRDDVPVVAAVAQSAWSSVLVLSGTFEQIVTYTGFSIMLFSAAAVSSLFVLRRRHGAPATYRVPLYPAIPIAFIATAILVAIASFRYAPGPSLSGIALIAVGYVCSPYSPWATRRRQKRDATLSRAGQKPHGAVAVLANANEPHRREL